VQHKLHTKIQLISIGKSRAVQDKFHTHHCPQSKGQMKCLFVLVTDNNELAEKIAKKKLPKEGSRKR